MAREKAVATGYSGTPLLKKLGVKPGARCALLDAPEPWPEGLAGDEVTWETVLAAPAADGETPYDVIVAFVRSRAALERGFARLERALGKAGGLWFAWPKRASGVATDLTEGVVRATALGGGLVDNKVCAIDATWSGLRCVRRLKDR